MTIEVKVPVLPESVADATVSTWHKKPGDRVERDENLVDLETDKVVLEVPAPEDGVLSEIVKEEGSTVTAEEVLAMIEPGAAAAKEEKAEKKEKAAPAEEKQPEEKPAEERAASEEELSPAVRRLVAEHDVDISKVKGTGKNGRITKEDVQQYMEQPKEAPAKPQAEAAPVAPGERPEKRVPMSRLRARIAERLVSAQQNAAMLTTFNEVDLHQVMALRKQYKDTFVEKHGVKLGFMSFFTRAAIEALKQFPEVNASIDGKDIVYHGYYDIGIAVSTERGLVVPVLRDADHMNLAEMEKNIGDYAKRASNGQLSIDEMTGGTFTITNGGVFGSLLSTPIINPPQTAILGMHKIQERPVVENGQVVIRPMMYLALSYDHRLVDGKDSVQFLVKIKELLEDPARLLLKI